MHDELLATLLARQGIYNKTGSIYAYELLYRSSNADSVNQYTGEAATSSVITQLCAGLGIQTIVGNKKAFINFTYEHLIQEIPYLLPKDRIVIEVLETVTVDKPLINSLISLKSKGYTIALDDFILNKESASLVELADIIKLDVLNQNKSQIAQQLLPLKEFKGMRLAEKIENHEQFINCVDLGFDYFQGFFLNKPDLLKGQVMTENKSTLVRLLVELNNENIAMERLEEFILQIPRLSYRVLRLANSVYSYTGIKIDSLIEALRKLGLNQIRDWLYLFLLSSKDDVIPDLLERSLIRAKMCENLASISGYANPHQAYTVGIFSTLDSFLNEPMESLLSKIQLSELLVAALLQQKGELGALLQVTIDYEKSNFTTLEQTHFNKQDLTRSYLLGIEYAGLVMDILNN